MARPKKHNADYFSHDNDMRNDEKVLAIRRKFGLEGYAVWNMMLEKLTGSTYFELYINSDIDLEILAGDFGIELNILVSILDYMYKIGLLVNIDNKIYSIGLKNRLQQVLDKRQYMKELAELRRGKKEDKEKRAVTNPLRRKIFEIDRNKCRTCGSEDNLEIDHILELCNGGTNDIDNLQLLCKECHKEKTKLMHTAMRTHNNTNTVVMQSKVKESKDNNKYILYTQDINFVRSMHKKLVEEGKEGVNRYVGNWLKVMFNCGFKLKQDKKAVEDIQKRFENTMIKYIGRGQSGELPYEQMDNVIDKLQNWLDNGNSTGNFKNSIINFLKSNKK